MSMQAHAWGSNFSKLADHMRSMLDEMQSRNFFRSHAPHAFEPPVNLYETKEGYYFCLELAGMPRKEIDVRVDNGHLYICGERPKPTVDESATEVSVALMEIDSGPFKRKLPLPDDVDANAISARYRDGFLWISIARESRPRQDDR